MEKQALEKQLFDWKDWDPSGTEYGDFVYYDITLKVDIVPFHKGTYFPYAFFCMSSSRLTLEDKEGNRYNFHLSLSALIED